MRSYSQNREDLAIAEYFGEFKGTLLDIGANDGITFSNSRLLIENRWQAHLLEPGHTFHFLDALYPRPAHGKPAQVRCYPLGIGNKNEVIPFWQSGAHVKNGKDSGLVSTFDFEETKRWPEVEFIKTAVRITTFETFCRLFIKRFENQLGFDFITIDAEGFDWIILQQIDLTAVNCKCLCIEHNGNEKLLSCYRDYVRPHGMIPLLKNNENIIFIKP